MEDEQKGTYIDPKMNLKNTEFQTGVIDVVTEQKLSAIRGELSGEISETEDGPWKKGIPTWLHVLSWVLLVGASSWVFIAWNMLSNQAPKGGSNAIPKAGDPVNVLLMWGLYTAPVLLISIILFMYFGLSRYSVKNFREGSPGEKAMAWVRAFFMTLGILVLLLIVSFIAVHLLIFIMHRFTH